MYNILTILFSVITPLAHVGYENGAVAADHPKASEAGVCLLKQGGNSIDAAIAASFALSVVRPHSCGLGGGGLALGFVDNNGFALIGRETCPNSIGDDFIKNCTQDSHYSKYGARAIATPGFIQLMLSLHKEFGSLKLSQILEPSIRLAELGFEMDEEHCRGCDILKAKRELINKKTSYENLWIWETFCHGGNYKKGAIVKQNNLSKTLKKIATGNKLLIDEVLLEISKSIQTQGGVVSKDDMLQYKTQWTTPIISNFWGGDLLLMPPPSSGGLVISQIIGTLNECKQIFKTDKHYLIESMKHGFASRANLADDRFYPLNRKKLLDKSFWKNLAKKINPNQTYSPEYYGKNNQIKNDSGTSHLCVADEFRNGISITLTINTTYGSLVGSKNLGIVFNNEMDDFTTTKNNINEYDLYQSLKNIPSPGKWPLSSMSPTIFLKDNKLKLLIGASGGPRIISAVAQVILDILSNKMMPHEAISKPRMHHQWLPNEVFFESGYPTEILHYLEKKGHQLKMERDGIARVQAIYINNKKIFPASDPRKHGEPAGW